MRRTLAYAPPCPRCRCVCPTKDLSAFVRDYNTMSKGNSDTLLAIGRTIAAWEAAPTEANLAKLQELFGLCLQNVKPS